MIQKIWDNEKIRYLLIGAYNTIFGYSIFALLWLLLGQKFHYIVLLLISHIVSVTNAFLCYRALVFRKKDNFWVDFFRFNLVYLGTLTFNVLTLPVLIEVANIHPLFAQAMLVIVTVVTSYLLHRRFSFKFN